jgi:hydrogenase-4 component F
LVLVYSVGYLRHIPDGRFSSPRWFYGLVFLFLFTMVAVYLSANLGLMWILVEATTLASALLVGFYNTEGAVEAGWKYLIVCTVGIAFALFGTITLYLAAVRGGVPANTALDWTVLMSAAPKLAGARDLLKLAFVFVAVGYGTKIGFVPMHSWLPDAHAEAPAPISALLSAVLLNCAMYALLRFDAIVSHTIGSTFSHRLLLIFGALSVTVAAFLMIVQRNLKRLLAYSSIEHMGIVALGVGLGGTLGIFGALLHAFNHSLAKTLLFFTTGNIRENFGTLQMDDMRGMARALPWTSSALIVGAVAIVGMPPFGLFVSELAVLGAAFSQAHYFIAVLMLAGISVVFGALLHHFQQMLSGDSPKKPATPKVLVSEFAPMAICAACLLVLGVRIPNVFANILHGAMAVLQ